MLFLKSLTPTNTDRSRKKWLDKNFVNFGNDYFHLLVINVDFWTSQCFGGNIGNAWIAAVGNRPTQEPLESNRSLD